MSWHPAVVHFPLALVLTAAAAFGAARLAAAPRLAAALAVVGTWNLGLGAVMALVAAGTGLAAVLDLHLSEAARHAVTLHVKWAVLSLLLAALLAVWRGAGSAQDARPTRLFVVLVWLAAAAMLVTGYRGGQNVYRYGIGVGIGVERGGA